MTGALLLVTDFLYGSTTTAVAIGAVAVAFFVIWFGIPLQRLLRQR